MSDSNKDVDNILVAQKSEDHDAKKCMVRAKISVQAPLVLTQFGDREPRQRMFTERVENTN